MTIWFLYTSRICVIYICICIEPFIDLITSTKINSKTLRLLQQRLYRKKSPLAITLFQNFSFWSRQFTGVELRDDFLDKTAFTIQLLIARKLNSNFSLQVSHTFVHRSLSSNSIDDNTHFVVGFWGRYKISYHLSIVFEYYYLANKLESIDTYGAFALGANWEVSSLIL